MTDASGQSDLPTAVELLDSVLFLITGAVVAAPVLPGFTLCVPGLIMLALVVLVPLVAAAALVTLAAASLAIPYLLVRFIHNIRSHRTAPAPESAAAGTAGPRAVTASRPFSEEVRAGFRSLR